MKQSTVLSILVRALAPVLAASLVLVGSLGVVVEAAPADPPELMNYQGVLRDATDAPLDGTYDMEFSFHYLDGTVGNCTLGSPILTDTHEASGTGAVTVTGGLFNVALGGGVLTPGTEATLAEVFRDHETVWLQVQVGTEVLCPRVRVISSAYSLNAAHLAGQESSYYLDTSSAPQTKTGLFRASGGIDFGLGAHDDLKASDVTDLTSGSAHSADALHTHTLVESASTAGSADTLDGIDSSGFLRSAGDVHFTSGTLTLDGGTILRSEGTIMAPQFQDTDGGSYMIDPTGVSVINELRPTLIRDKDNTNFYLDLSETSSANLYGNLHIGAGDGLDDDYLYFDQDAAFIRWSESGSRFEIEEEVRVESWFFAPQYYDTATGLDYYLDMDQPVSGNFYGGLDIGSGSTTDDDEIRFDARGEYLRWDDSADRFVLSSGLTVGGRLYASGSIQTNDALELNGRLFMSSNGPDGNQEIFFYEDGSRVAEYFSWNDSIDRFQLTDELAIAGPIRVGTTATSSVAYSAIGSGSSNASAVNSSSDLYVTDSLELDGTLYTGTNIYVKHAGPDGAQNVYFYENGSAVGESIRWDDVQHRFEMSDGLNLYGNIQIGGGADPEVPYNRLGAGLTAGEPEIVDWNDVYVVGDMEVDGMFFPRDIAGPTGGSMDIAVDTQVRIMFDRDNTTTANLFEWYHDGTFSGATKLAELQEDGDLRIRGLISQNTTFDLAESFVASEPLEAGDVVRLDPQRPGAVLLSTGADDALVLGVVSEQPGMLLGSAPFDLETLERAWGRDLAELYESEREAIRVEVLERDVDTAAAFAAIDAEEGELELRLARERAAAEAAGAGDPAAVGIDGAPTIEGVGEAPEAADTAQVSLDSAEIEALRSRFSVQREEVEDQIESRCLEAFHERHVVPVALAGRVPVRVDLSGGEILPGDPLAPGPTPGVAMRADGSGPVIGTALEGFAGEGEGKVLAFVHRGGGLAAGAASDMALLGEKQQELEAGLADRTPDPVTGVQSVPGNLQLVLDRGADDDSRFSVFRDGEEEGALGAEVFRVDEAGNVYARGSFRPDSMDLAEYFPVSGPVGPGDVLVVDRELPGSYWIGESAGDPAVIGVVSSEPGVLLGSGVRRISELSPELAARLEEARALGDNEEEAALWREMEERFRAAHAPVALSGTVPCKVDAGYGEIRPGDLLTTSPTPGHAMRADEALPGTIVGKALGSLESGTGTIRILVMLR